MVDFKQATEWLKEEKKVKRSCWVNKDMYFYYVRYSEEEYRICNSKTGQYAILTQLEFEATDWEIYKEDVSDDWCIYTALQNNTSRNGGGYWDDQRCLLCIDDMRTLKEKMLEDVMQCVDKYIDSQSDPFLGDSQYTTILKDGIYEKIEKRFGF